MIASYTVYRALLEKISSKVASRVRVATCRAVAQASYYRNKFQLTHMPRGNHHAQSIASNGDQKEDKTLLQHSQLR